MRAWLRLLLAGCCYALTLHFTHRYGSPNTIVDLGFQILPEWYDTIPTVLLDLIPYGLLIILLLDLLFHVYDHVALCHAFSSMIIWRALCNMTTILPPPHPNCSIEGDGLLWLHGGCHDMIFSGHMAYTMFIACVLGRQHSRWKRFWLLFVCVEFLLLIVARAHYTVDCVLGVMVGWFHVNMVSF